MAMKRCPTCGEKYSDTYKSCPFCEEEEAMREDKQIRRGGHHGSQQFSIVTPTLIVLILLMAGLLTYLLKGEPFQFGGSDKTPQNTGDVIPPEKPLAGGADGSSGAVSDVAAGGAVATPTDYDRADALPSGLTLSTTDFTMKVEGEYHTIRASGGSGSYTWVSEDEGIASVDQNGKVTAVSSGTVNVIASDGSKKGVCIVRIRISGSSGTASGNIGSGSSGGTSTPSGGSNKLNREDMTMTQGETFPLTLSGVTTALTWSSADPSIANVAEDGTVTAVASGTTTITVSWDGRSASCIVRVK